MPTTTTTNAENYVSLEGRGRVEPFSVHHYSAKVISSGLVMDRGECFTACFAVIALEEGRNRKHGQRDGDGDTDCIEL